MTAAPTNTVIPGSNTTFTVQFAPSSTGFKNAQLQITNNDSSQNPFTITLTGTGTDVFVATGTPITLNPQTGLFEQTVRVTNSTLAAFAAVRVLIQGLPGDVEVRNASGTTNGTPYLQYNLPLAPAAAVEFLIEYYRANRDTNFQPTLVVQSTTVVSTNPAGTPFAINSNVQLSNGRFLIEFSTNPGLSYAVQYSSDLLIWKTAVPFITAPLNRVQWFDDGPPKTESKPTSGSRFYRVMQLP